MSGGLTCNGYVVNGSAGSDTITTDGSGVLVISGAQVGAGISINAGGGADSINVAVAGLTTSANNAIVLGGAGGDTITVSDGEPGIGGFSKIGGGDGGDLIFAWSAWYSGIGGGAGSDTIELTGGSTTFRTGMAVATGAGNDVISGVLNLSVAANVLGGGGADTISLTSFRGSGSVINGDSTTDGGGIDVIDIENQVLRLSLGVKVVQTSSPCPVLAPQVSFKETLAVT